MKTITSTTTTTVKYEPPKTLMGMFKRWFASYFHVYKGMDEESIKLAEMLLGSIRMDKVGAVWTFTLFRSSSIFLPLSSQASCLERTEVVYYVDTPVEGGTMCFDFG